ncbi:hypothetical protein BDP55DRAFT_654209 [Colletotrichum godetiae]|uniref:Uncharacterized protein n=1 Tax=Colletotrichum godetiae TaxID=1209918 RepID=A0AAJ0AUA9_9PEZI|nr:uncharacterized protein BDP55DRAFT_654209 [Colletotrichum godetiae]KAK1689101.1 hypothetical protein BDP55DRAFT_654209 [Colletotrichum godetiae]
MEARAVRPGQEWIMGLPSLITLVLPVLVEFAADQGNVSCIRIVHAAAGDKTRQDWAGLGLVGRRLRGTES